MNKSLKDFFIKTLKSRKLLNSSLEFIILSFYLMQSPLTDGSLEAKPALHIRYTFDLFAIVKPP